RQCQRGNGQQVLRGLGDCERRTPEAASGDERASLSRQVFFGRDRGDDAELRQDEAETGRRIFGRQARAEEDIVIFATEPRMLLTPNLFAVVEGEREGEGENEIEIEALSPSPSPKNLRKMQKPRTLRTLKTKLPEPGQVHPPTLPTA